LLPSSPACKKLIRFYWISLISLQLPYESPWDGACKKKLIKLCRIRLISLLPSRNLLGGLGFQIVTIISSLTQVLTASSDYRTTSKKQLH
jgi:hypothetical protein